MSAQRLPTVSAPQQRAWRQRLKTAIREAGYGEPTPLEHAASSTDGPFWEIEPTPLVIDADDWAPLEAGLRQRARFVNAFLFDAYDRQEVLKQGLLPPDVLLGDPYYRRPCLRLEPDREAPATLLRFDLVKSPSGWQVAQTRANTPIGLSFAVQTRRFLTQEASDLYRRLPDHHSIINFPLQLLDTLSRLAPRGIDSPSIIMLTAGLHDPFYAEHSFLARKMGIPLAKGDDLLVLDNRVYFKTITGLERVDVLYRRLNDAHIDPVVFHTDRETAGIPGLLQSIRAGNVVVANAIGTGIAESRALDVWLTRLMRFYLGEKPVLPSIPTYTCGDTDQLDYILERRDSLRVMPAHDRRLGDPRLNEQALLLDHHGLAPEVRENPFGFVAREVPRPARGARSPRCPAPLTFTAFVLAHGRDYNVLPGGLVQCGRNSTPLDRVGVTTDAVVLRGPDAVTCDFPPEAAAAEESPNVVRHALGSRTAESLFWLGRYVERAEATARMLSIMDDVVLEEIPARERRRWVPLWQGLLEATGHSSRRISARERPAAALAGDLNWRMTLDARQPSSIHSSVDNAVFNARKLRDYVSPEAWAVLHRLCGRLETLRRQGERAKPHNAKPQMTAAVEAVLVDLNAFYGTAGRTMLHDAGWRFLCIGMHLERAVMTCSALRHVLSGRSQETREAASAMAPRVDNPELSALLRMLGSQDAYRRLYQTRSQPRHVADFFLKRREAPRSLLHNLEQIDLAVRAIGIAPNATAPLEAAVADLLARLEALDPVHAFDPGPAAARELGEFLSSMLSGLGSLHPLLSDHYFSHQARLTEPAAAEPAA